MKKRRLGPCVTFFPQPATLIVSQDSAGQHNLMMASWAGIVSKTPPTIAVSLHRDRQTYANILSTGRFTVNVVSAELVKAADFCGLASGKQHDKLALTGLHLSPGIVQGCSLIDESPLNVECQFSQEVELGDYRLVMGEIMEIHARDDAYDNKDKADVHVFDPVVYLGGLREYFGLGEKLADAYREGLALMPSKDNSSE